MAGESQSTFFPKHGTATSICYRNRAKDNGKQEMKGAATSIIQVYKVGGLELLKNRLLCTHQSAYYRAAAFLSLTSFYCFFMTRPLLAVLPLSQMNVPQKIDKGQYLVKQWLENGGQFPKTNPYTAAQMGEAVTTLTDAHTATQGKSSLAYAQQDEAEAAFNVIFSAHREWTNQSDVAYDNKVKIELLGFDSSRESQPAGPMPAPMLKQPSGQEESKLDLVCEKIEGMVSIIWFVAYGDTMPADEDYRYCDAGTRLRQTLPLRSGQMAWIRAIAVGTQGAGPIGAPVKRRVL